jgi:spermidine synthase
MLSNKYKEKYIKYKDKYVEYKDKYIEYKRKYLGEQSKDIYNLYCHNNKLYFNDYRIEKIVYQKKNIYQDIKILQIKNRKRNKILIIDNELQLLDADIHIYHEMLVHVSINYFNNDNIRVLIIGGGDGGTLKEVLKHNNVKEVVMVEIDADIIEASIKYMPSISENAFKDPRAQIIIGDGLHAVDHFIKKGEKFDLILLDLSDTNTSSPLLTETFHRNLKKIVNNKYLINFNADNLRNNFEYLKSMIKEMYGIFKYVEPYLLVIPSYDSGYYYFCLITDTINPRNFEIDWKLWSNKNLQLKYYNKDIHYASFALPTEVKNIIDTIKKEMNILDEPKNKCGIHFILDMFNVDSLLLNDYNKLDTIYLKSIDIAKMTLLGSKLHQFQPQGITGMYLLGESHLSFHTWPEKGNVSIDLYTCGDHSNAYNAIQFIIQQLNSKNYKLMNILR